jgi:formylglycine-generating enzyme required for sulfatase activity
MPRPRPKEEAPKAAVEREVVNSIGMKLVYIPPGKFTMGSPADEKGRSKEEEEHEVEITKGFYLGVYEVTQSEYQEVMGANPSQFSAQRRGKDRVPIPTNRFPVENVLWYEAKEFCEKLTAMGKEREKKRVYRLPTEAEWEYACRGGAGRKTPYHCGNTLSPSQANFENKVKRTCEVGLYKPNGYGLYDMHGNVWEWCSDYYGEKYYATSPRRDPPGASEGPNRVVRGGSWLFGRGACRSADRHWAVPSARSGVIGFRVALVPFTE